MMVIAGWMQIALLEYVRSHIRLISFCRPTSDSCFRFCLSGLLLRDLEFCRPSDSTDVLPRSAPGKQHNMLRVFRYWGNRFLN